MIVQCEQCGFYFEDNFRSTICPHGAFPANDGNNNFSVHDGAYLGDEKPTYGMSDLRAAYAAWWMIEMLRAVLAAR